MVYLVLIAPDPREDNDILWLCAVYATHALTAVFVKLCPFKGMECVPSWGLLGFTLRDVWDCKSFVDGKGNGFERYGRSFVLVLPLVAACVNCMKVMCNYVELIKVVHRNAFTILRADQGGQANWMQTWDLPCVGFAQMISGICALFLMVMSSIIRTIDPLSRLFHRGIVL